MPTDLAILRERNPTTGAESDHTPEAVRNYLNAQLNQIVTARGQTLISVVSRSVNLDQISNQRIHYVDYDYN